MYGSMDRPKTMTKVEYIDPVTHTFRKVKTNSRKSFDFACVIRFLTSETEISSVRPSTKIKTKNKFMNSKSKFRKKMRRNNVISIETFHFAQFDTDSNKSVSF